MLTSYLLWFDVSLERFVLTLMTVLPPAFGPSLQEAPKRSNKALFATRHIVVLKKFLPIRG